VIGCFSTALTTASAFFGIPVARVGTDLLLERITPYENSNRVPLTVIDAACPTREGVGHRRAGTVQARRGAHPLVARSATACSPSGIRRCGPRRRPGSKPISTRTSTTSSAALTSLRLPGGSVVRAEALRRNPTVRRAVRKIRARQAAS